MEDEDEESTEFTGKVSVALTEEEVFKPSESFACKFEQHSFLPLTCPIFTRCIIDSSYPKIPKKSSVVASIGVESQESTSSGVVVAQDTLENVLADVFNAKSRKRKKPLMVKNEWMALSEVLPDFEIDDETFNNMIYRETLLINKIENTSVTPVGALSFNVQSARGGPLKYQNEKTKSDYYCFDKFLIHLSSQFDFCGHNGGSRIMSWVDRNLQTLEETRKEFIHLDQEIEREKLYVNCQEKFYYLRHNKLTDIYYSAEKAKNLICEGANFILMRYLAIKRFIGSFEVCTVHINGNLCRNIYTCKGPQSGLVFKRKLDVCRIERTIIEECGLVHRSIVLLTLGGRILKQEWSNCDYILQVNPATMPLGNKPSPSERIPLDRDFNVDLQMLSLYLDAKTGNTKKIDNYLNDYPEIKQYISDYVMTVLHLKPENVFEFTAQYFLGFAPQLFPYTEYFQPSTPPDDDDELNFAGYF